MHNDIDRDLYEILGVDRNASPLEIKGAYRSRARECHPDVAHDDPDGERKFKELSFAYEILYDEDKRRDYDRWGLEGLKRGAGIDFDGSTSFADLFDVFFGGAFGGGFGRGHSARARTRGRDMEARVRITLGEVLTGAEKKIEVRRMATCGECEGTGMMPGTHTSRCSACDGTGQITSQQRSFFGTLVRSTPCGACGGAGETITEPCRECAGAGRKNLTETIEVSIPPGVERGDHLLVRGRGEGGLHGGPTGDLYVGVDVQTDRRFERDGTNLLAGVTVGMVDAALGTELQMESVDGDYTLKVPAGIQPGEVIKVKGKGLPPRGGGRRGNVLVRVEVSVPKKLSGKERKLLEQLQESHDERVHR